MQVSTNGESDGGRCKDELDVLCHAGKKSALFAQGLVGIVEGSSGFGDGTGHLRIAEGESQIHDDHESGGDGQP